MIGLGLCKNVKDVSIVVDVASITATYYHFDSFLGCTKNKDATVFILVLFVF